MATTKTERAKNAERNRRGRSWADQVAARRNGQVPGFLGHNETLEEFEARQAAEAEAG